MRCSVQIPVRSPKAIGLCAVESADRISTFACIWHAHPLAAQSPTHSHLLQTQRRLIHCFFTLLYAIGRPIIQNSSFTLHSTLWDVSCPTFCKFSVPNLGHGCTSCFFSFCPAIHSFECHLMWLQNQICRACLVEAPLRPAPPTVVVGVTLCC